MRTREPRGRPRSGHDDVVAGLQAALDREERRRQARIRLAAAATAVALVVGVAGTVLLRGNASAEARRADAAAVQAPVIAQVATVTVPTAQPETTPAPLADTSVPAAKQAAKPPVKVQSSKKKAPNKTPQVFRIAIGNAGYEPSVVRASASRPVVLSVGRGEGCAAGFLIPKLRINEDNSSGRVTVNLGRLPAGRYQFSCGMGMVTGSLIVR